MAKHNMYKPEPGPMQYTTTTDAVKPVYGIVANCSRLNVRKKPHRSSEVLTVIEEDDIITIEMYESTRNWYYVKTESGVEGYCMKDFIVLKK